MNSVLSNGKITQTKVKYFAFKRYFFTGKWGIKQQIENVTATICHHRNCNMFMLTY